MMKNDNETTERSAPNAGESSVPNKPTATTTEVDTDSVLSSEESDPEIPENTLSFHELKEQAAKATEHWDKLLRLTADFENYKKRINRERLETSKYANESLLQKLIPILDNFEKALTAADQNQEGNVGSLKEGIQMIHGQLKSTLMEFGLEEIDATGQVFDPNFHEAVSQQESAEVPEGHVLFQLRKGYKLRDRLLRPATVVVAKPPSA